MPVRMNPKFKNQNDRLLCGIGSTSTHGAISSNANSHGWLAEGKYNQVIERDTKGTR